MSAPDTNIEKQKRRHRGPLVGIALSLVVVGMMFVVYLVVFSSDAQDTEGAPAPAVQGD